VGYQGSVDHPGADGIDADAGGGVFKSRGLGQAYHAVLAGHIGGLPGEAFQSRQRCRVHDGSLPLLEHVRDLVLHTQIHAFEVGGHHAVPVVLGGLADPLEGLADAGVVEGAVESTVGLNRLLHHGFHLGGL